MPVGARVKGRATARSTVLSWGKPYRVASMLDGITSLKVRLSIIICVGIASAVAVVSLGRGVALGWFPAATLGTAVAILLVRLLAHGTTSRIRDLALAARAVAAGDHDHRVTVRGRDEVSSLANAFNDMADQLTGLDRMRRSFVADASHELRTPIAAARAVLENMVDGVDPATPERLAPVLAQVERLGRLVEQLLNLSLLESGAQPLVFESVDLREVAVDVAAAICLAKRSRVVEVHGDDTAIVPGDRDRLRQVVANLVDNAVRFAPPGTAVAVSACKRTDHVELRVVDLGPGIRPEERERVFERFARGDRARASRDGGAGLGLAIVRSIVDQHGGTVEISAADPSMPIGSQGCAVTVVLRRAGTL